MKKEFDCVEMKRKAQEEIYEEIKDLSLEEEIKYFNEAGERFWREIEAMREKKKKVQKKKASGTKASKKISAKSSLKSGKS